MTNLKILRLLTRMCAFTLAAHPAHLAQACGGGFPIELTQQRDITLYGLYEGNFWFEAARLQGPPSDQFAPSPGLAVFRDSQGQLEPLPAERIAIETAGYSDAQKQSFDQARAAKNAAEAFSIAQSLPNAHQLYIAGAVAFRQSEWADALIYFDQVIALTDQETNDRLLWAHFMRGQSLYEQAAESETSVDSAIAAFGQLRTLAAKGKPDELGLAMASLGEQARWQLRANQLTQAAHSYAALAAMEKAWLEKEEKTDDNAWRYQNGDSQGAQGLLTVARRLYQDQALLDSALQDPLVRKLMIVYAYARAGEVAARDQDLQANFHQLQTDYEVIEQGRQGGGSNERFLTSNLSRALEKALAGKTLTKEPLLDRLSAVMYRAGEFETAQRFAQASDAPLAAWVQAKLALRSGKLDQAAAFYAKAARDFPANDAWLQDYDNMQYNVACRVEAESATMHLMRGDFNQAAELFWQAKEYERDLAYVAERVLSIDELRNFVRRHAAEPKEPDPTEPGSSQVAMIRSLFARRLMRQEHYREAIAYFDQEPNKANALAFSQHMENAARSRDEIRAEHLYEAALLARHEGIRLFAYELAPDQAAWGGSMAGAYDTPDDGDWNPQAQHPFVEKLATAQERGRFLQTDASPMMFFHYRGRAALLAERASESVPARSQAFASLMCKATLWTNDINVDLGQKFYLNYIRKGPYVPWAEDFGNNCEEPDFASAAELRAVQNRVWLKRTIKRWAIPIATAGVLLMFAIWRWRRSKQRN
jgi:cellulose synthase operon protein C